MMVGIVIAIKTQCPIRVMYRVLFHGFKKDLGPGLYKAYIWLPPFGEHPLASTGVGNQVGQLSEDCILPL